MVKAISVMKNLVELYEDYLVDIHEDKINMEGFVLWLNKQLFGLKLIKTEPSHDPDIQLTFLISLLNKQYKSYTKTVLANSEISNAESYSFLYHLSMTESLRKMELINMHQLAAPSGIEILKRLLLKKMISEFDDEEDKRSKRVKITNKGQSEIKRLLPDMKKVYQRMSGDLDLNEKIRLISFLKELNDYHIENN